MRRAALHLVLLLAATASGAHAQDISPPEEGFRRATAACAQCHALTAGRASPNPGAPSFAAVGSRYPDDRDLADRLGKVTRQGHYAMPPRVLSPGDRQAIVAYIREAADRASRE